MRKKACNTLWRWFNGRKYRIYFSIMAFQPESLEGIYNNRNNRNNNQNETFFLQTYTKTLLSSLFSAFERSFVWDGKSRFNERAKQKPKERERE